MFSLDSPPPERTWRVTPFASSVLIHIVFISWALFGPKPSVVEIETRPELQKKYILTWYPPKIPEISPAKEQAPKKSIPRPLPKTDQTILANKATEIGKQLIYQLPKVQLQAEVPLPNIVQFTPPPPPPPPPKVEPVRKAFVPPPTPARPVTPNQELFTQAPPQAAPRLAQPVASLTPTLQAAKPQPKTFVPPSNTTPRPQTVTALVTDAPPPIAVNANDDKSINALVIGLNPIDRLNVPLPPGSLARQVSGRPDETVGKKADGATGNGVTVPDVTVRTGKSDPPSPPPVQPATTLQERLRAAARSSVSAPLRTLPRVVPVQETFKDRTLYTCLVEMPGGPVDAESFVLWFGERDSRVGSAQLLRAPVLVRAGLPALPAQYPSDRIYIRLIINRDGLVASIVPLDATGDTFHLATQKAVSLWEFSPATKNGQPIDIEAVVEIPARAFVRAR